MKIRLLVSLALLASTPVLVFAEQSSEVRYSGNVLATQICRAVVQDDAAKLRMLLRSYRQTVSRGYMFNLDNANGIARDFTCNNLDLLRFSNQVGAQKVSAYFAGDSAAAHSQVAATAEYSPD